MSRNESMDSAVKALARIIEKADLLAIPTVARDTTGQVTGVNLYVPAEGAGELVELLRQAVVR